MNTRVEKVCADNVDDFFKVHSGKCSWCYCTAWWTPSWEGWTDRTDKQNKKFREELFANGEFDGYLLYLDDDPVGWCQVGQRDRLDKLIRQYNLTPNPQIWAVTCFVIHPEQRRKGLSKLLLEAVLEDLKSSGVKIIQAFPKKTESIDAGAYWMGPIELYLSCGFEIELDDSVSPILAIKNP